MVKRIKRPTALRIGALMLPAILATACGTKETPLPIDGQASGSLARERTHDQYRVQITEAGLYEFGLHAHRPYLEMALSSATVQRVDSHLPGNPLPRIVAHLQPGAYTLRVTSTADLSFNSRYIVTAAHRIYPGNVTVRSGGALPADGRVHGIYDGEPLTYRLHVPTDAIALIDLRSIDFAGMLRIDGPDSGTRQGDASGYDARLIMPLKSGRYTITVDAADEHRAGLFALKTRLFDAGDDSGPDLHPGSVRIGLLGRHIHEGEHYELQIDAPGRYAINLFSSSAIPRMYLSDGEPAYSESLSRNMAIYGTFQPGRYPLRIDSLSDEEYPGPYLLVVSDLGPDSD